LLVPAAFFSSRLCSSRLGADEIDKPSVDVDPRELLPTLEVKRLPCLSQDQIDISLREAAIASVVGLTPGGSEAIADAADAT